ncbi:vWA domain-containing protein [Microtetraspora sp. NBRC 16547]|uniref:vWA domain-containing protein n=1 Tax=Microtetraspora sp. NBRC 16547 TaxID=3030993 RepID=UPI002553C6AA|nr:vWA domain-containing protein [Microtetraspora sp. NBRC 16547]
MTRRLRAAACVVVAGAMLVAGVGTASAAPGVTPADVTLKLAPGGSTTIAKTVSTPAIPPKPDITVLIDTTGSMGEVISNVQTNANTILSNVASAQPDAHFAVAEYRDVSADATAFRVAQNLTANQTDVTNGLNSLVATGGGDFPEDGINGLFQVASGAVHFRPNSSRIVLLIGDAPSHDPSNGHTLGDAISALQAADITVLAFDLNDPYGLDSTGQATAITNATGGRLFTGINPSEVSDTILAALHNLPVTVTHQLRDCDPNLSVSLAPGSRTVTNGDEATFTETVSVGAGAVPGSTLTCKVDFLLNGVLSPGFTETITEHVPKATPSIATTPSGPVPAGGNVSDTATLSGGFQPTGTVTFQLFGPGDTGCATPIATRAGTVSGSGTAVSGNVTIGAAGTYRWAATYSGDAHNNSVTSPCSAEQVTVTPQRLTGRAYGLTADASLAGIQLVNIAPTPDTGHISTTSTSTTSVPCTATLSGLITAHTLCAQVATTEFPGKSVATASIDDTTIGITGIPVITVKTINSSSTTTCAGSTGTTTIAFLKVGNTVVIAEPTNIQPNTAVNVGVVKLVLNEQTPFTTPDKGLTVNAAHITVDALGLAKTNVVLASSESDIGNCP